MRRRVFTLIAALSAVICLLSTVLWVRSFFAFDSWASNLYNPSAQSIDVCSIEAGNGRLLRVRSIMQLPPGIVPLPQSSLDGTWAHASVSSKQPLKLRADVTWFTWFSVPAAPRPSSSRSYVFTRYTVVGVRL